MCDRYYVGGYADSSRHFYVVDVFRFKYLWLLYITNERPSSIAQHVHIERGCCTSWYRAHHTFVAYNIIIPSSFRGWKNFRGLYGQTDSALGLTEGEDAKGGRGGGGRKTTL